MNPIPNIDSSVASRGAMVPEAIVRTWNNKRKSARVRCATRVGVLLEPKDDAVAESRFTEVEVRDLSQSGIAFFSKTAPRERPVILKLSTEKETVFLLASVMRCARDFDDPQRRFVLGCKFVRRIAVPTAQRTKRNLRTAQKS